VLRSDPGVVAAVRLVDHGIERPLGKRQERDLAPHGAPGRGRRKATSHSPDRDPELPEDANGDALPFPQESEELVLRPDVVVPQRPRLVLRDNEDLPRAGGEPLEHRSRLELERKPQAYA